MVRRGAITYEGLPISSGGAHSLRLKGLVSAFEALKRFVNAVSLEPVPTSVVLELFDLGEGGFTHFLSLEAELDKKFDRKQSRQIGEYTGSQWEVSPTQLEPLIYDIERLRPIPNAGYAGRSLVVNVFWNLVFADPNGHQLPFQSRNEYLQFGVDFQRYLGESFVYARISETSTAHLFLSLPFEEANDEARSLVTRIQTHFPARLSSKHWKRWTLTKNNKSYVGRKIPDWPSELPSRNP
ncbi:MAG: hypothetical protein KA746_01520 [Pyrinomonadaceae bacterium]|nr:hypothetical protein [Pyrinomonadaceae bacterium]MBP6211617.1 hypothetical protein [Pyrinomonadaceae bacterium]